MGARAAHLWRGHAILAPVGVLERRRPQTLAGMERAGGASARSGNSIAPPTRHVWVLEKFISPNVPLINGLCLGGGIGISLYGTHCVAGEGYRFGMPQVGIGFLPDIGGTYFLPRMLGRTGLYLALTGRLIGPAEAYRHRLVSHCIPSAHFHVIKDALADNHPIDRLLDGLHRDPGEGELVRAYAAHRPRLFRAVSRGDSRTARSRARRRPRPSRRRPRPRSARSRRPRSRLAFAQLKRGKALDLASALKLEFRLASHLIAQPRLSRGHRRAHRRARAARRAGSRRRSMRSTIRPSSACSRLRPRTSLSSKNLLRAYKRRKPARSPKLNARISCNLKRLA